MYNNMKEPILNYFTINKHWSIYNQEREQTKKILETIYIKHPQVYQNGLDYILQNGKKVFFFQCQSQLL